MSVLEVEVKDMWKVLAPTLESLSIRCIMTEAYKKTMQSIETFYRKLTCADIGFYEDRWESHAELYLSYGAELKLANLS